jgi:Domain of unknown function (DUF1707)/Domain of unknown function (DUF4190)
MTVDRPEPGPHLRMRAADADRERAIDVLRAGFAEGRLTKAEYTERAGAAQAARTYGELAELTMDLPAGPVPGVPAPAGTNETAVQALIWGLVGLAFPPFGAFMAVILGHVARGDIRRSGEPGAGFAVAALTVGYGTLAAIGVLIVLAVTVWT